MALYDNIFARIGDEFADSTLSDSIKYLTDVSELLEINNFKYLVKHEGDVLKKAALKEELGINSRTSYIEGFYFEILEKHIIRFNEELNLIWKYKKAINEDFTDVDLFNLINKYNLSQIKQFINNNFKSEYSKIIIFDNLIDNTINIEGIKHLFIIKVVKSLVKDCEEIIETNATTIPYYNFEKLTNYNFIFAETIDVNKIAKLPNVTIGSQIFLEIDFDNVTFKGNITDLGNDPIKRYGFFWSLTNPQPYEGDNVVEFGDTNSILAFQKYIDSLEFGSTVYVRSFAENSYNIVISDVATFKTKEPSAPILNLGQTLNDTSLTVTSVDANNPLAIKFNLFLSSIGDSKPNQILNDIQHIGFKYYTFENPDVVLDNFELSQQENQGKTIVASNTPYKSDAFYAPALGKYYVEAYAENSYLRTTTPKFLFKLSIIPKVRLLIPNNDVTTEQVVLATQDFTVQYYDLNRESLKSTTYPTIILNTTNLNNNNKQIGKDMLILEEFNTLTTFNQINNNSIEYQYTYDINNPTIKLQLNDFLKYGRKYRLRAKNFKTDESIGIDKTFLFNIKDLSFSFNNLYSTSFTINNYFNQTDMKSNYIEELDVLLFHYSASNAMYILLYKVDAVNNTITAYNICNNNTNNILYEKITSNFQVSHNSKYDSINKKLYIFSNPNGFNSGYVSVYNFDIINNILTFSVITDFAYNRYDYTIEAVGAELKFDYPINSYINLSVGNLINVTQSSGNQLPLGQYTITKLSIDSNNPNIGYFTINTPNGYTPVENPTFGTFDGTIGGCFLNTVTGISIGNSFTFNYSLVTIENQLFVYFVSNSGSYFINRVRLDNINNTKNNFDYNNYSYSTATINSNSQINAIKSVYSEKFNGIIIGTGNNILIIPKTLSGTHNFIKPINNTDLFQTSNPSGTFIEKYGIYLENPNQVYQITNLTLDNSNNLNYQLITKTVINNLSARREMIYSKKYDKFISYMNVNTSGTVQIPFYIDSVTITEL